MLAVFAIVTRNRLYQARTLFESVEQHDPGMTRVLFLVDPVEGEDIAWNNVAVMHAAAAVGAGFPAMAFEHNATALCCALKPFCAQYVLTHLGQDSAIYLDADTLALAPIASLLEAAPDASMVLTPHLLRPIRGSAASRSEIEIIESGIFNAGVIGFRRNDACLEMLEWWGSRMRWRKNVRERLAYDQHWLDLAFILFAGVQATRDPGFNVGYWNLHERPLGQDNSGSITVAPGKALRIFHFSFFNSIDPSWLVKRGEIRLSVCGDVLAGLVSAYSKSLQKNGMTADNSLPYRLGTFRNGRPISEDQRQLFAERVPEEVKVESDPFNPAYTSGSMRGWRSIYRRNYGVVRLGLRARRLARRLLSTAHF